MCCSGKKRVIRDSQINDLRLENVDSGRRDSVLSSLTDSVATDVAVGVVPAPVAFLPESSDAGLVGASVACCRNWLPPGWLEPVLAPRQSASPLPPGPSQVRCHRSRKPLREATSFIPRIYGGPRPNS